MRILILFNFFLVNICFSQSNSISKNRITCGLSMQYEIYSFKEFESSNNSSISNYLDTKGSGYSIDLKTNFQNRYIISAFEFGFNYSPIDNNIMVFLPEFKNSFNINFNDKKMKNFIGPFVSVGYFFPIDRSDVYIFKNSVNFSTGFLYSRKYIQLEIGTMFRNKFDFITLPIFKSCFYTSIGFRIPLKKQPKN